MWWFAFGAALAETSAVGLDYLPAAELSIPLSSAGEVPEKTALRGPFRLVGVVDGVRTYEARHSIRPRALFFERQPPEMELFRGERRLMYDADPADRGMAGTWEATASSVLVRVRAESERPVVEDYHLVYPPALAREERLRCTGGDAAAWAFRSAQVDDVTRHGVLLSGAASVGWDVTIPEGATLRMEPGILPPEVDEGARSDGATLEAWVGTVKVGVVRVTEARFDAIELPLPASSGPARLRLVVTDADTALDHVFVASPTLHVKPAKPRKVVLAFIDTLRRDHLPTYGYERATAPKLDAWAKESVVFEDARTVAPWTLPATRALWTGRHPEHFASSRTLQEVLRKRGWATGAFVGNVYLSSNFEMDRGWGEHGCLNWPGAAFETWRARDFLRRHQDEDALVLVHFMDLHLPYKEPSRYRGIWEGERPRGLREMFNRTILMQVAEYQRERVKPFIVGRYDQNLRYVDDQLSALLGELGDDATVVLFADHGEEFFDHGDLEHGHTLYDELLRIPLVVRSPGLTPRRVDAPVTLLDVAPTVLDLLGIPTTELGAELEGASLAPAARTGDTTTIADRSFAIGRALYGGVQWGSVADGKKYITTKGREELYDLRADPGEAHDLVRTGGSTDAARTALATDLDRELVLALRVTVSGRPNKPVRVDLQVPGGVEHAWVGDEPTAITRAEVLAVHGEFVELEFESRLRDNREIFIVPKLAGEDVVGSVGVRIEGRMSGFDNLHANPFDGSGTELSTTRAGAVEVSVTWAVLPLPVGEAIVGADGELSAALEALGYTTGATANDDERDKDDDEADPDTTRPD